MRRNTIHDTTKVIRSRCEINEETECFEWHGPVSNKGYGRIRYNKEFIPIHRATWQYHNGAIPDGLHVLHKCDNRRCCVPAHLYLGTNGQNIKDKVERDRSGKKLSIEKAAKIKSLLDAGVSQARIAKLYGIGQPTVSKIKMGLTWNHVVPSGG